MKAENYNDKIYLSNRSTYFINKYVTSFFLLICFCIISIEIVIADFEYKVLMLTTLICCIPVIYFLFLKKFLFLKHLYIENGKIFAEDRGNRIQIHLENIYKFKRSYFFYHSGLFCLHLKNKTDFGKKIYFTIEILKKHNKPHEILKKYLSDNNVFQEKNLEFS